MREYQNSKSKIIAAAVALLAEKGPGHLPVEDIAARAEISKGGFFYNFKTKEDLLHAIIETLHKELAAQISAKIATDAEPYGRGLRVFVQTFLENERAGMMHHRAILACYVEIFTSFPTLQQTFRPLFEWQLKEFDNGGMKREDLLLITSAMDGIMLTFMLGVNEEARENRMQLIEHMIRLTYPQNM